MISASLLSGLFGAVLGTSVISGVLSLAGGTILMGVFGWVLPISTAMIFHGCSQMASNASRCILYRAHIQWWILRGYLLGTAICIAIFATVLYVPNKVVMFLLLGLMPFVNFALPKGKALDITKRGMPTLCGFLVTVCQLLAGVSGPLLDVFYNRTSLTRFQIHSTKGFTQAMGHAVKVGYFVMVTQLAAGDGLVVPLWALFAVMPVAFLGNWIASKIVHLLSDQQFRSLAQLTSMAIGVVFLGRAASLIFA